MGIQLLPELGKAKDLRKRIGAPFGGTSCSDSFPRPLSVGQTFTFFFCKHYFFLIAEHEDCRTTNTNLWQAEWYILARRSLISTERQLRDNLVLLKQFYELVSGRLSRPWWRNYDYIKRLWPEEPYEHLMLWLYVLCALSYFYQFMQQSLRLKFIFRLRGRKWLILPSMTPHNLWTAKRKAEVQPRTDDGWLKKKFRHDAAYSNRHNLKLERCWWFGTRRGCTGVLSMKRNVDDI